MTRDHLLGCRQYIPDVENERWSPPYRKIMSVRHEKELEAKWAAYCPPRDPALTAFENVDHTPAEMKPAEDTAPKHPPSGPADFDRYYGADPGFLEDWREDEDGL